jgi:alpha-D-xyloside xylohydrolase
MDILLRLTVIAIGLFKLVLANGGSCTAPVTPYSIVISNGRNVLVNNSAILTGTMNSTAKPVLAAPSGTIVNNGDYIAYNNVNPSVVKVQVTSNSSFIGARFTASKTSLFYGVWEYPFNDRISNDNIEFDLKGLGNSVGINWSNARAPFFITNAGYGVYADTLSMGSFDFTSLGQAQFIFNTSSLIYYIITPTSPGDYKSIIEEYTALSSRIEMPPDSGYGPTFWSDDFEQDFHGSVSNAQENYYDVINHLYYNEIRATSMFADRKSLP